ncbi:MAG: triose-phosphate isomerase [Anaerolineales bacterium]
MRKPCVAGNWKMHKNVAQATSLVKDLIPGLEEIKGVENVLCPPFTSLAPLSDLLEESSVQLGAQNMYWEEEGAFTGEISPLMLSELVSHVIIGHSERRAYFGETDETVNRRLKAALDHGLIPILCVGETLEENEAGRTQEVVSRQVKRALEGINTVGGEGLMIAYEPVWAIGTGKAATPVGANAVIADVIRPNLGQGLSPSLAEEIRVLYGGSVKPHNAAAFFDQPDIDGALVGGASLKAEPFIEITKNAG